jgi:uridine kinase
MIGEHFNIKPEYFALAEAILERVEQSRQSVQGKYVIAIAGESGSGKSMTARCLATCMEQHNIKVAILHQDDYFKLAPADNHKARQENTNHIGPTEVLLELLQQHIDIFKQAIDTSITKPIIDFANNTISTESIEISEAEILIVEGTYSLFLENGLDYKIFMSRTYLDTYKQRMERGREGHNDFIEEVLAIEHKIIAPLASKADIQITKEYTIK